MAAIELELKDLTLAYGKTEIVRKISFIARSGLITCIIGANGAGKTTTLRGIFGLMKPLSGKILLDGNDISGHGTGQTAKLGMGLVPEGRRIFPTLSVIDNLRVGAVSRRVSWRNPDGLDEVYMLFPELKRLQRSPAGSLSGGEQQMLAIGRALMMRPRLLALDEPSMGLALKVTARIYEALVYLRSKGETTILLSEQNAKNALSIGDYAAVLECGDIAEYGRAGELKNSERIKEIYLGTSQKDK